MTDFASIKGGRIYLDTIVTSELTLAEVLVKPMAEGKTAVASIYRALMSGEAAIGMLAVDRSVLIAAAEVRAKHGGRLFDAIHGASAVLAACDVFLTQDLRISAPSGLRRPRLSEIAGAP